MAAKKSAPKKPAKKSAGNAKVPAAKKPAAKKPPAGPKKSAKPAATKGPARKAVTSKSSAKKPSSKPVGKPVSKPATPAKAPAAAKPAAAKPATAPKPPAPKAGAAPKPAPAVKPVAAAKPATPPPAPVAMPSAAPVAAPAASGKPAPLPKHGGISEESVKSATGRGWEEWFTLIDGQNGATLDHRGIVAIVAPHLQKSEWWAQMVTVAYEQARGLRKKHEKTDGFQVGASRVLEVSVSRIYAAFFDPTLRARWLSDPVTIKAATLDKSLRMTWKDNTPIDVYLYAKGEDRASVAVQHGKNKDEATAAERKAFWKAALDRLAGFLVRR